MPSDKVLRLAVIAEVNDSVTAVPVLVLVVVKVYYPAVRVVFTSSIIYCAPSPASPFFSSMASFASDDKEDNPPALAINNRLSTLSGDEDELPLLDGAGVSGSLPPLVGKLIPLAALATSYNLEVRASQFVSLTTFSSVDEIPLKASDTEVILVGSIELIASGSAEKASLTPWVIVSLRFKSIPRSLLIASLTYYYTSASFLNLIPLVGNVNSMPSAIRTLIACPLLVKFFKVSFSILSDFKYSLTADLNFVSVLIFPALN